MTVIRSHMNMNADFINMTPKIKKIDLSKICDWSNLTNVAIEHYFETNRTQTTSVPQELETYECTTISYLKIYTAQKALKNIILQKIKSTIQQFIGIHYSVPIYCVPSLILGIISAGHAFIYLSEDQLSFLINLLGIKYLFLSKSASTAIKDVEVIKKFWMHKESLIFSKIVRTENDDGEMSDIKTNESKFKSYLAYAITTSGSTRAAVPVKVSHASLLSNILDFRELFKLTNTDKIAQLTPLTFDPSLIEIFLSFSSGATIVTVSDHLKNNPNKLLDILYNRKITFFSTTPSLFLHRGWSLDNLKETLLGKTSNLRILLLGGEIFPKLDLISNIKDPENRTKIFNVYGITEVSCWASIQEIFCNQKNHSAEQIEFNLGTILSDTIFQVRDIQNNDHVIDEGEGILYIGSHTRICIIGDEKLDNLKPPVFRKSGDLVKVNKQGEIIFKGRQDTCIKRFGHKVYLNDLNYHAQKLHYIEDSYSFVFPPSNKLYLFLTISNEYINHHTDIINDVWVHIKSLPAIMYPDGIHILNHFEMTEHGKICKQYLMNICTNIEETSNISYINARDIKRRLQESWINHLHCPINNINLTRFIDVGGTSLIALQIFTELVDKSQRSFPNLVGMFLENKTLEECLNYIDECNSNIENNLSECDIRKNNHDRPIPNINNYSNNVYIWQKCRGRTTIISLNDNHPHQSMQKVFHESIIFDVNEYQTYNLKKCVDASPTVFGYSFSSEGLLQNTDEESAFVCVGSHLGIICTVELNANHPDKYKKWEIQLPQTDNTIPRIEASILVLDNFRGVVGCHNGNIYCIHLKTGEIYWTFATNDIVKCSAELCSKKENIFIGSYDHYFYCISTQDGSLVWRRKVYSSICSTPLVHDETGNLIICLLNGMCICLDQTSGDLQWEYRLENPIFSSPIALNDNVVVVADVCGNLIGLKIVANNHCPMAQNHSNRLWNFNTSGQIFSDLVVFTDSSTPNLQNLIFASKNGFLYRYHSDNSNSVPKLKYRIDCGYMIVSTPWVNESIIIVGREDGILKIIDYQIGCFLYSFSLRGNCFSSPVLCKNFITVGCRDDNLYVICLQKQGDKKE